MLGEALAQYDESFRRAEQIGVFHELDCYCPDHDDHTEHPGENYKLIRGSLSPPGR